MKVIDHGQFLIRKAHLSFWLKELKTRVSTTWLNKVHEFDIKKKKKDQIIVQYYTYNKYFPYTINGKEIS